LTDYTQAIVLGVVQGITEWLPISSEGINTLVLINIFEVRVPEAIAISIWLHLGTLLAATVYFRKELQILLLRLLSYVTKSTAERNSNTRVPVSFLLISTLITGMIGAPLYFYGLDDREIPAMYMTMIIGVFLIITGLLQKFTEHIRISRTQPHTRDALLLGCVQAFSVFPGLSRSGLTVSALLFRGYKPLQALRLSFLMSIPVILVAEVGLGFTDRIEINLVSFVGVASAFICGLVTISLFIRIAVKLTFWKLCIFLGIISLLAPILE